MKITGVVNIELDYSVEKLTNIISNISSKKLFLENKKKFISVLSL